MPYTDQQLQALQVLEWMSSYDESDRGSGRTQICILAAIRRAVRDLGRKVEVIDHFDHHYFIGATRNLLDKLGLASYIDVEQTATMLLVSAKRNIPEELRNRLLEGPAPLIDLDYNGHCWVHKPKSWNCLRCGLTRPETVDHPRPVVGDWEKINDYFLDEPSCTGGLEPLLESPPPATVYERLLRDDE